MMPNDDYYFSRSKEATDILSKYCWKRLGTCKRCRKRNVLVGARNICKGCATMGMAQAAKAMVEKRGGQFIKWKSNILRGVRRT